MQYQEEVEILNMEAKQRPHLQLIAGIQRENKHLREIQAENKELRNALEDHQHALELIMSKYRQQTASLLRLNKTDYSSMHNSKHANVSKMISVLNKLNFNSPLSKILAIICKIDLLINLIDNCNTKDKECSFLCIYTYILLIYIYFVNL